MATSVAARLVPRTVLCAVLAAATVLGGAGRSAQAETVASVAACDRGVSEAGAAARVRLGVRHGSDPNDLTATEVAATQDRIGARLRKHGLHWNSHVPERITIDVRMHVITRADGSGGVTDDQIRRQIDVLNAGYGGRGQQEASPTPFRFRLKSVDRTPDDDWFDWSDPEVDPADDAEAKTALHRGGRDDLNVYVASLADGLLGYAQFPDETSLTGDGVVVLNESLPGGAASGFNEGDTLTHEAGHWLGLLHTFENGCANPGDHVADTPYQADGDNIFECDAAADTCPAPGRDPVHNFMSYGDDPCMDRFTTGQALRMGLVWLAYRQP
jgi:hypothetical protein